MLRNGLLGAILLVSACAPMSKPAAQTEPGSDAVRQSGSRGRVTLSVFREPDTLAAKGSTGGAGGAETRWMVNSPLTYYDAQGAGHPMTAETIPTRDNGDWVVSPDGTMTTTYRLRSNASWHDGVPLTAQDFAFAYQVYSDPAVAFRRDPEDRMSAVEAPDDRTVVIRWAEPYIYANLLNLGDLPPLPRHRLEEKYRTDRANFASGDEWTTSYVGSGPFRIERWESGVRMIARAYRDWVLGAPRIDTVEVRFIGEPSAVLASILAGEVDFAAAPAIRLSDALVARDQWSASGEGYVKPWERRLRYLDFQFREVPNWQRAMADVRVRQALLYAIDRAGLADVMTRGLGHVGDAWVLPSDSIFSEVDGAVTKYPFDPERAAALLGDAGWRRQAGSLLANPAGQTLDIEVNSGSTEPQLTTIIGDNWKTAGINANLFIVPNAQQRDLLVRTSFPAVRVGERSITIEGLHLTSSQIPKPPGYIEANFGSFSDAEVDRLHSLAITSLEGDSRRQAAVALNKRLSELAGYGPLYYNVEILLARSRLTGPVGEGLQTGVTWNIFEWEVTD